MAERIRQLQSHQVGVFDDIPFDESCFGKMFDLTTIECQYCANQSFCGNKHFNSLTIPPEMVSVPFLDGAKLDTLDRDEVIRVNLGKPKLLVLLYLKAHGKVSENLAAAYLEVLCKERNLIIKNGILSHGE